MPRRSRQAFTVIELLVVIAIVSALAALVLLAAGPMTRDADRKRTEAIIHTVKTGIALTVAHKGSAISPTEHPFAGSQADAGRDRFSFVRTPSSLWPSGNVATTGTALRGVPNPRYLSGNKNNLMMADDRYNDPRIVLLFGAKREDIGVLQSLRKVVTKFRTLPMPPTSVDSLAPHPTVVSQLTGLPPSDYLGDTNIDFPDTLEPSVPKLNDPYFGTLSDNKSALDYVFGNSNAQAELASLKALYNADPTLPEDQNKFRTGVELRTVGDVSEPLVYTNVGTGDRDFKSHESKWKPGYIPITNSGATRDLDAITGSTWVRYRLPGLAVYDAWGNELMTVMGSNSNYRVISAGKDGALAIDPGQDSTLNGTTLSFDAQGKLQLHAKDKDGSKDNPQ